MLAVCKILLESRAFRKDELEPMLRKLINNGVPREKQKAIKELISNELFHYIEPQHEVSTPMRCIAPMDVVSKAELRSENTH